MINEFLIFVKRIKLLIIVLHFYYHDNINEPKYYCKTTNNNLLEILAIILYSVLGRQFDKYGNLKQWWNNETIAEFRTAAHCIIEQYNNYTLDPYGLQIDGRLTQGENIADNGGLKQAYRVIFVKTN